MSFFLIKLLQTVDSITLDLDSQPLDSRVPNNWKNLPGRAQVEQFSPRSHLTMYAYVSAYSLRFFSPLTRMSHVGRIMGEDERSSWVKCYVV